MAQLNFSFQRSSEAPKLRSDKTLHRTPIFLLVRLWVRYFLGGLLIAAAGMKGFELAYRPLPETNLISSRWFLIPFIGGELLLGLWLCSGLFPRVARIAALIAFSLFAGVSVSLWSAGASSCGCFPGININPNVMAVFDALAVIALLLTPQPPATRENVAYCAPRSHWPPMGGVICCSVSLLWLAMWITSSRSSTLTDDGQIEGTEKTVAVTTDTWRGNRFPLLAFSDLGDRLAFGSWFVVLYKADCTKCQEIVRLAGLCRRDDLKIAMIELPPYHHSTSEFPATTYGRLSEQWNWRFATPLGVALRNGKVTAVMLGAEFYRRVSLAVERRAATWSLPADVQTSNEF